MSCIFCKIINQEIPSTKVYEDENVYAFNDINPAAKVHVLIIPKDHIETVLDIENKDKDYMKILTLTANKIAKKLGIDQSGFRLVVNCNKDSGQEVFHLHMHLIGGQKLGGL